MLDKSNLREWHFSASRLLVLGHLIHSYLHFLQQWDEITDLYNKKNRNRNIIVSIILYNNGENQFLFYFIPQKKKTLSTAVNVIKTSKKNVVCVNARKERNECSKKRTLLLLKRMNRVTFTTNPFLLSLLIIQ